MIGSIQGMVQHKQLPIVLIEAGGLGYEVETSMTTFFRLPEPGQTVRLLTHLVIREDAHILFGFATDEERTLFRALIKVNGVGPKLALAILSTIEPAQFTHCIRERDSAMLMQVPGVGKKTAERLLIEMYDRIKTIEVTPVASVNATPSQRQIEQEAVSALLALGYSSQEASRAISRVSSPEHTSEQLIRLALQGMLKHD